MAFISEKSPEKRFDLESYVYSIMRISETDLIDARARWLSGFDLMYGGHELDFNKLLSYVTPTLEKSAKFTPLTNAQFASSNRKEIDDNTLAPVYVPINDEAHISFWVTNRNINTSLGLFYDDAYVHDCLCSLPYVHLGRNLDLSEDFSAMRRLKEGTFDVADDIVICPENFVDVMDSYTAFNSLIKATRK